MECDQSSPVCRLTSWLSEQTVSLSDNRELYGSISDCTAVFPGVPQESVLGPFRFSIYVDDLASPSVSQVLEVLYLDYLMLHRGIQSNCMTNGRNVASDSLQEHVCLQVLGNICRIVYL